MKRIRVMSILLILSLIGFTGIPSLLGTSISENDNTPTLASIPGLDNYVMTEIDFRWVELSGVVAPLWTGYEDDGMIYKPLGFNFHFYDRSVATVGICTNGFLSLRSPTSNPLYWSYPFPLQGYDHNYMIAPFWDDLKVDDRYGSLVYAASFSGPPGKSYFVAEWENIQNLWTGGVVGSFQVILYESGDIVFSYEYIDPFFTGYRQWICGLNFGTDDDYFNMFTVSLGTYQRSVLFTRGIHATVDFDPDTLNRKSRGKWVTVYIGLPEGYDVNDIDIDSVSLEGLSRADSSPTEIIDHDGDGRNDLMVKFDRQEFIALLEPGENVEISITGTLNGMEFEGTDTISVIH